MARVLMIIAPERFRDEELFETAAVLRAAGHQTTVASTRAGPIAGSRGGFAEAETTLEPVLPEDFDGVVFVGGGGSRLLFENVEAHRLAREAVACDKVLAAICLAPVILARAGVLSGRAATVAGTEVQAIEEGGARYTGPGVTVDDRLVTANGPKSSRLFGQRICELLPPV